MHQESTQGRLTEDHSCDLRSREAVHAQDCNLADSRIYRHDHRIGDSETAQQKTAAADGPSGGLQYFELRVGAIKLRILQGDQIWVLCLDHAFKS